jgi:hypothetical protein
MIRRGSSSSSSRCSGRRSAGALGLPRFMGQFARHVGNPTFSRLQDPARQPLQILDTPPPVGSAIGEPNNFKRKGSPAVASRPTFAVRVTATRSESHRWSLRSFRDATLISFQCECNFLFSPNVKFDNPAETYATQFSKMLRVPPGPGKSFFSGLTQLKAA